VFKLDEDILRTYFRLEEAQRQRLWMARLLHPETFKWVKRGGPPSVTETKLLRIDELEALGFGEAHYQKMLAMEEEARKRMKELVEAHPLWPHFEKINIFGHYLGSAFIAAGGDITRAPTVSSFWSGMGLTVNKDGSVPRRVRGSKNPKGIPCLPHVSRVGEQIRQQIIRSKSMCRLMYEENRQRIDRDLPDKKKIFRFKDAIRRTQKVLYACLWREWRLGYNLDAPDPYAFTILRHSDGSIVRITDLYDK